MITIADVCVALNIMHIHQTSLFFYFFRAVGVESPLSEAIEALGRADEELQAAVHCDRLCCSKEQRYREGTVLAPTLCRFIPECKSLPHGKNGICHYSNLCVALDQMSSLHGEKRGFE